MNIPVLLRRQSKRRPLRLSVSLALLLQPMAQILVWEDWQSRSEPVPAPRYPQLNSGIVRSQGATFLFLTVTLGIFFRVTAWSMWSVLSEWSRSMIVQKLFVQETIAEKVWKSSRSRRSICEFIVPVYTRRLCTHVGGGKKLKQTYCVSCVSCIIALHLFQS